MEGLLIGVFGTEQDAKQAVEASLGKKSEAEGTVIYHRTDSGKKVSLLDDSQFPGRIQGYARIASLCDRALYLFPRSGRLSAGDGELAVLLDSFSLRGRVELVDSAVPAETVRAALKGTSVAEYPIEERDSTSTVLDLRGVSKRDGAPPGGTLLYIDRAFTVKGVGTVALGFVLSGSVSLHDRLRPIPGRMGLEADVKGIQINDEDFGTAGRGLRVGLSLRGVEPADLEKAHWMDDGTFPLSDSLNLTFSQSAFYRAPVLGREMHLQLLGETQAASIGPGPDDGLAAKLQSPVPVWGGMRSSLIDLNGTGLRVAGGGVCKL